VRVLFTVTSWSTNNSRECENCVD